MLIIDYLLIITAIIIGNFLYECGKNYYFDKKLKEKKQ